jgi:FkbM family methyltransferase
MGSRAVTALRSIGVEPLAISDNNLRLWGTHLLGTPIVSPAEAVERFGRDALFFITIRNELHWYRETHETLTSMGCAHVSSADPITWRFPEMFLPFLLYDLPHKVYEQADQVLQAAELWSDDESRSEFLVQVRLRALGNPSGLGKPVPESYILDGIFELLPSDVLVDCGAYDGDTIREWIRHQPDLGAIEAVEADTNSFSRLQAFANDLNAHLRNKIRLHQCALGAEKGKVRFENDGTLVSKISNRGNTMVDLMPIDDLVESTPISMIKMDIEGGEFDALLGARKVIQRDRPILAICAYHLQQDLWRLPLLMRSMVPEYRMYLKEYRGDGIQTIVYAVPPERLLRE